MRSKRKPGATVLLIGLTLIASIGTGPALAANKGTQVDVHSTANMSANTTAESKNGSTSTSASASANANASISTDTSVDTNTSTTTNGSTSTSPSTNPSAANGTDTKATNAPGSGSTTNQPSPKQPAQTATTVPAKTTGPPTLSLGAKSTYVLYLQQSLAKLGYLPLQWTASSDTKTTVNPSPPYTPEKGKWTWSFANTPATLKAQWASGVYNQLTKGAVMTFQEVNHLGIDGVTGPKTWAALTAALKQHKRNPWGYSYVYVSQGRPETMRIWKGGRYVFFSYVNTGIPSSPTPYGTWPIYIRYTSQTMSGYTPSGQYYSDPGVPWVNYFYGGCAIHGFVRQSYGYSQSLGCVELPVSKAKVAWTMMHYGTLVTVGK